MGRVAVYLAVAAADIVCTGRIVEFVYSGVGVGGICIRVEGVGVMLGIGCTDGAVEVVYIELVIVFVDL